MAKALAAPGARLRSLWKRCERFPGGRWLFSRAIGLMAPYTATVGATVARLEPGYALVTMPDRRRVRNHLDSVHAVALANLAELASGLAVLVSLPASTRGILTALSISYLKKARGALRAECRCEVPASPVDAECDVTAVISDAAGEVVARAVARWRLGPVR